MEDAACLAAESAKYLPVGGGWDWPARPARVRAETYRAHRGVQSAARMWDGTWHIDGFARTLRTTLIRDRDPADFRHIDWLSGTP